MCSRVSVLPRPLTTTLPILLTSILLSGCGGGDLFSGDTKFFPTAPKIFSSQSWATATKGTVKDVYPSGPVQPEDYVDAAGRCGAVAVAAAPVQTDTAVGTVAGDLGTVSGAPQEPEAAPALVAGGISLGMTECQVAQRAGQAAQVSIGEESGDRKTVLTYQSGPWPGAYTFVGGRLKQIDRVALPEPVKPAPKKKAKPAKPKSAAAPAVRTVQ